MALTDLNEKTVIELRKLAKEWKVPLGAGISKAGIIEKLTAAMAEQEAEAAPVQAALSTEEAAPVQAALPTEEAATEEEAPADASGADEEDEDGEAPTKETAAPTVPAFRQAYVAPPRFNSKPSYQAPAFNRQSSPRPASPTDVPRTQTTRPVGYAPRFGPAAAPAPAPAMETAPADEGARPVRSESRMAPVPERRPAFERPAFEARPAYEKPAFEARPAYEKPAYEARPAYEKPAYDRSRREAPSSEAAPVYSSNPSVSELIAPADAPECTGILEIMPDGYGFLRGEGLISTGKDVLVATAQVRRFGLRSGDRIVGKVRPQRDGDKYPALLVVSSVNGRPADSAARRPQFENLTPIYPNRRMDLGASRCADVRLVDLIAPIGFGQRGLIQCGPRTGKARLIQRLANAVCAGYPDAQVMVLLFNENPEDVTSFREQVKCPVYATTFDMPPENHVKVAELLLEAAMRQVELGRDVVLLADSLTSLMRVASAAATQQARAVPGLITPAGVQKAKRLFGAGRCLREGGSLTVLATMNTDAGAKADDGMVAEFRGAANMELTLDQNLVKAGMQPPILLSGSGTRRADALVTPAHLETLRPLRAALSRVPAETALQEALTMVDQAKSSDELLALAKTWAESVQG